MGVKAGRVAVFLAALGLLLGAPATPAAADDFLVASDPEPHEELDSPPGWVTLVFQTQADADLAKIVVQNSAGQDVSTGSPIAEGTNVTTQLMAPLPRDTYTVTYRTSDDANGRRGGAFQFSYGPGTWTEVDDTWIGEEEEPSVIATPPPPAPEPSETPEPEPTATETAAPTTEPTTTEPTESPTAAPAPTETANPAGWLIGIGAGLVAVAAGAVAVVTRRRVGSGSDAGTPPAGDPQA